MLLVRTRWPGGVVATQIGSLPLRTGARNLLISFPTFSGGSLPPGHITPGHMSEAQYAASAIARPIRVGPIAGRGQQHRSRVNELLG